MQTGSLHLYAKCTHHGCHVEEVFHLQGGWAILVFQLPCLKLADVAVEPTFTLPIHYDRQLHPGLHVAHKKELCMDESAHL